MPTKLNRRQILASSAIALTGAYCAQPEEGAEAAAPASPTETPGGGPLTIKKSLKFGMFREEGLSILEKFEILKEIGFDGVELDSPADLDQDEIIAARNSTGLEIPGVISALHWSKPLSDPDPAVRDEGRSGLEGALRAAARYGATTVLLVPAVVKKEVQYDDVWTRSQAEIRKALPVAREVGVKIAIENVWNSFLYSPLEMARYVDELNDSLVGAYFDVGNVINFGWPEQWIRILGLANHETRHQGIQPGKERPGGSLLRLPGPVGRGGLRLAGSRERPGGDWLSWRMGICGGQEWRS